MGNAADWIEDSHYRLYYGGTMPETYLADDDDPSTEPGRLDDDSALGYEAAQPALQVLSTWQAVL